MDILEKCFRRSIVDEVREMGLYPYFRALESRQDREVIMEKKRRIMLGSNNYLGLTTQPEIVEAGISALEQYGTGCSGSRFLNGTLTMHLELEAELARFLRKDDVVTFSTGFQSNLGIISALVGKGDYVICDRENHASIYDGCKLSYGKMERYRHADMGHLEKLLQQIPEKSGVLIVTDGVFSMGGDIALTASDDGLNAAGGTDQSGQGGRDGMFGGPGMGASSNGSITISGGTLAITAYGDGIDANGSLEITGGHIVVTGPTQGDTSTLDYDTTGVITGGTFIGTGASGMAQTFSSSEQGVIAVSTGEQSAGTQITLTDSAGNTLISYTPALSFAVVILSSPDLVQGETYVLTVGSLSGEFEAS